MRLPGCRRLHHGGHERLFGHHVGVGLRRLAGVVVVGEAARRDAGQGKTQDQLFHCMSPCRMSPTSITPRADGSPQLDENRWTTARVVYTAPPGAGSRLMSPNVTPTIQMT